MPKPGDIQVGVSNKFCLQSMNSRRWDDSKINKWNEAHNIKNIIEYRFKNKTIMSFYKFDLSSIHVPIIKEIAVAVHVSLPLFL